MPRGKKGPIPEVKEDPTAEQITGSENIVTLDNASEKLAEVVYDIIVDELTQSGYKCADCTFRSNLLSDLEQHVAETGHGGGAVNPADPVQPELFAEKGVVHRMMNVMLPAELLNEKRARLAELYQSALEVKSDKQTADADFNARLKNIDEQMQQIARVLRTPYTYEKVDCEWRVIEEENARGLYRLDTGEMIDKQPLTAEDRAEELQKAEVENSQPEEAQTAASS